MPVATIDSSAYERVELKSLEGAYVCVRPLPYGMKLERREGAMKMFMEQGEGSNRSTRRDKNATQRAEMQLLQRWSTQYDFKYCIGDHNLEAPDGRTLDFNNRKDFEMLDPRVGSEIERILDDLNNEDDDIDEEDFTKSPSSYSEEGQTSS